MSPLDDEALRFCDVADGLSGGTPGTWRVDGDKLERFLLKAFLGLLAGKQLRRADGTTMEIAELNLPWLKGLYGREPIPAGEGLAVEAAVGAKVT